MSDKQTKFLKNFLKGYELGLGGQQLYFNQPVFSLYNNIKLPSLPKIRPTDYPYAVITGFKKGEGGLFFDEFFFLTLFSKEPKVILKHEVGLDENKKPIYDGGFQIQEDNTKCLLYMNRNPQWKDNEWFFRSEWDESINSSVTLQAGEILTDGIILGQGESAVIQWSNFKCYNTDSKLMCEPSAPIPLSTEAKWI